MEATAQDNPTTETSLTPDIRSAEVEKPVYGEQPSALTITIIGSLGPRPDVRVQRGWVCSCALREVMVSSWGQEGRALASGQAVGLLSGCVVLSRLF